MLAGGACREQGERGLETPVLGHLRQGKHPPDGCRAKAVGCTQRWLDSLTGPDPCPVAGSCRPDTGSQAAAWLGRLPQHRRWRLWGQIPVQKGSPGLLVQRVAAARRQVVSATLPALPGAGQEQEAASSSEASKREGRQAGGGSSLSWAAEAGAVRRPTQEPGQQGQGPIVRGGAREHGRRGAGGVRGEESRALRGVCLSRA